MFLFDFILKALLLLALRPEVLLLLATRSCQISSVIYISCFLWPNNDQYLPNVHFNDPK